jgi:hypothetical protein
MRGRRSPHPADPDIEGEEEPPGMSLEDALQLVETLAVISALGFGLVQLRQYRLDKNREAALALLKSFQTPEFAKALNIVYRLPEGLSKDEIEEAVGDDFHLVYALMTTWESLGVLVHRGEMSLDLVDDFFSGPITVSWRKLKGHVFGEREIVQRETVEEWFQWLAERFAERESGAPPVPAHIAHRDWTPPARRV